MHYLPKWFRSFVQREKADLFLVLADGLKWGILEK